MTLSSIYGSVLIYFDKIGNKSLKLLLTTQFLDEKVATMINKRAGNQHYFDDNGFSNGRVDTYLSYDKFLIKHKSLDC